MEKGKTVNISILAISIILYSLIWLSTPLPYFSPDSQWQKLALIFWFTVLISAIYLLRKKNWARILLIFQISLWGLVGLYAIFMFWELCKRIIYTENIYFLLIYNCLNAILSIYLLTNPHIKEQFK